MFNDGIGVDIASRLLYGSPFPENLNGTDSGQTICGQPGIATGSSCSGQKPARPERARNASFFIVPATYSRRLPPWPFRCRRVPELIDLMRRSKADVLLVAMGNPKQELFIQKHLAATGCIVGIGVGALFDFLAGNVPRADTLASKMAPRMALSSVSGATTPRAPLPRRQSTFLLRIARNVGRAHASKAGIGPGGGNSATLVANRRAIAQDVILRKALSA